MEANGAGAEVREKFAAQLARLLKSPEFSASRNLSEFLRYSSERAFQGAKHLDQVEIAREVLGRGEAFNPLDDASVRKLATLARQRLESYYAKAGRHDDVLVSLPVRSYVPEYHLRPGGEQPQVRRTRRWWLAAAPLGGVAAVGGWMLSRDSTPQPRVLRIRTAKGDLTGPGEMPPAGSVVLGPELGHNDEFTARLRFRPDSEAQQAGILIWRDRDNYVRLGRKFLGRNQIDFTWEAGADYRPYPEALTFDPGGQEGAPVWLSVTRRGEHYAAWWSYDGRQWATAGRPFRLEPGLGKARAGIYAYHGRREAPSVEAVFESLAIGPTFANWPAEAIAGPADGPLDILRKCPVDPLFQVSDGWLALTLPLGVPSCNTVLVKPVGVREWAVETRMDFFVEPGVSAGLALSGDRGSARLVRYWLNGPAICFVQDGKDLVGEPDFRGSPAVYLRLESRAGAVRASFSRDGAEWRRLGPAVPLDWFGPNLRAGLRMTAMGLQAGSAPKGPRFAYLRRLAMDEFPV